MPWNDENILSCEKPPSRIIVKGQILESLPVLATQKPHGITWAIMQIWKMYIIYYMSVYIYISNISHFYILYTVNLYTYTHIYTCLLYTDTSYTSWISPKLNEKVSEVRATPGCSTARSPRHSAGISPLNGSTSVKVEESCRRQTPLSSAFHFRRENFQLSTYFNFFSQKKNTLLDTEKWIQPNFFIFLHRLHTS